MNKIKNYLVLMGMALCITSCRTKTDFLYLKNVEPLVEYAYNHPNTKVHQGDKLQITVSSKNPELSVPFNSNGGAFLNISTNGSVESSAETRNTAYLVDDNGCIEFPLLGELKVDGLSIQEVEDLIKGKIMEGKYINNPLVTCTFKNFRYTMLGAAANGTQTAEEGHINIIQAIANAGGVDESGNLKKIYVYREENGNLKMYPCDLTDKAIFKSPCYQLQQNDIVYVQPTYQKTNADKKFYKYYAYLTALFGILTTTIGVINIFK